MKCDRTMRVVICFAWCLLAVCASDAVATGKMEHNVDEAASEIKKTSVIAPLDNADDVEGAEYREFQQFRFPDDPRFDPRLHQLSAQQQALILEDIRQHHRFHQQHQQQQQLHQQLLRPRQRQPNRNDSPFQFNQQRPVTSPQNFHHPPPPPQVPFQPQDQPQFNVIDTTNGNRPPTLRLESSPVFNNDFNKTPLSPVSTKTPLAPFSVPLRPDPPIQPVVFVPTASATNPPLQQPIIPYQPNPSVIIPTVHSQLPPLKADAKPGTHPAQNVFSQNTYFDSPKTHGTSAPAVETVFQKSISFDGNHNFGPEGPQFKSNQPYFPQTFNPPAGRQESGFSENTFLQSHQQVSAEGYKVNILPATSAPNEEKPKSVSNLSAKPTEKPLYFGDRKLPKQVSPTTSIPIPKIKFPKELEDQYSLVSVKHLNEAIEQEEAKISTDRPRHAKVRLENHLLQYGQNDQNVAKAIPTDVLIGEERKQLLQEVTKATQIEQAKSNRNRKPKPPAKEIIEITYRQNPSTPKPQTTKPSKSAKQQFQHPDDLQEQLLKQLQEQLGQSKGNIKEIRLDPASDILPSNVISNSDLLPKNVSGPVIISNGQKYQVIQLPAREAAALLAKQRAAASTTTTPKPPKKILEEITKGVLPPGAEFEVIRQKGDGALEPVGKLPSSLPDKKVTFVLLEEQNDGSYKVQGIRGNNEGKNQGEEVDSILKKIKAGELELPPPSRDPGVSKRTTLAPPTKKTSSASTEHNLSISSTPSYLESTAHSKPQNVKLYVNSHSGELNTDSSQNNLLQTATTASPYIPTSAPKSTYSSISTASPTYSSYPTYPSFSTSSPTTTTTPKPTTQQNNLNYRFDDDKPSTYQPKYYPSPSPSPTPTPWETSPALNGGSSTSNPSPSPSPSPSIPPVQVIHNSSPTGASTPFYSSTTQFLPTISSSVDGSPYSVDAQINIQSTSPNPLPPSSEIPYTQPTYISPVETTPAGGDKLQRAMYNNDVPLNHNYNIDGEAQPPTITDVLKKNGLFAMARYLRQSGLDSILNDTGPYTVFVPTDKAFKTLMVQLGGPDRAEEKFRENPRLLSGLLLHHVIPGAFRLTSLQDEMTGVSLAGTQLRVNTYTTQDHEWNDIQVVTVNGAQLLRGQHDMEIPQGIAHAVDRVMFPLPVGDLLQTLQADKDHRFATFLRIIRAAGLSETLTGPRTYTAFAPTERAFSTLKEPELARLVSERAAARTFVTRHVLPTTLYSAGMRYYQVKDTMARGKQITIVNDEGRIKANSAHIVTNNIPATNGVVHAIDTIL